MQINEFKDRMFDILNETYGLPIADIMVDDKTDQIKVMLDDHTSFIVTCKSFGSWFIQKPSNTL